MNNTSVGSYLKDGCGRCEHYQTPNCKVHLWTDALIALRSLLQESDLTEEMKWGSPTYTLDGKNVIMLASTRNYCAISFLKGAALKDDDGLLEAPGPNSRFAKMFKFLSVAEVEAHRSQVAEFIAQAIELERSGVKVVPDATEQMPEELEQRLNSDPELLEAFDALTPGRRRSYFIYISGAKQSETRARRVENSVAKIYSGKGYNER